MCKIPLTRPALGVVLCAALAGGAAAAEPAAAPGTPAATQAAAGLGGLEPLDDEALANRRGGTEVHNDMLLQGQVAENQAVNVSTGANYITDGSFANAGGVPMVVQNTGNNVLIQNATILNIQLK